MFRTRMSAVALLVGIALSHAAGPPLPRPADSGPRPGWLAHSRGYVLRTSDGWKLVARRYRVPDRADVSRPPVLLWPDLGQSGVIFDLRSELSLAGFLAEAGFDVWAIDPRGTGLSSRWEDRPPPSSFDWKSAVARRTAALPPGGFASREDRFRHWTFDDLVERDVPAAVSFLCHETGFGQIHCVGLGTGANVFLGYLSRFGADRRIGRLLLLAPFPPGVVVPELATLLEDWASDSEKPLAMVEWWQRFGSDNLAPETARALAADCPPRLSEGLADQWRAAARTGRWRSADDAIDYAAGFGSVRCPCLILGGSADPWIRPAELEGLMERLATPDRSLLILGRAGGFQSDYHRADLLLGQNARAEVYPLLARWLRGDTLGKLR